MAENNNDRYDAANYINDDIFRDFRHRHSTETADFIGSEKPYVVLKVFRNNAICAKLADNEVEILNMLPGSNHISGLIHNFDLDNHEILIVDPFHYTLKDNFKRLYYDETEFYLAHLVTKSLLGAMLVLNERNIIHRNITPNNVCIIVNYPDKEDVFKLLGFEHAIVCQHRMIGTIQTLHYRAPEVLLGLPYDKSVDMWSLGCTIFEIGVGHVLFHGYDELDQICRIVEVFGNFPDSMIEASPRKDEFFDYSRRDGRYIPKGYYHTRYFPPGVRTLESLMTTWEPVTTDFANLLRGMMEIDPTQRLTPIELLYQPFIYGHVL